MRETTRVHSRMRAVRSSGGLGQIGFFRLSFYLNLHAALHTQLLQSPPHETTGPDEYIETLYLLSPLIKRPLND